MKVRFLAFSLILLLATLLLGQANYASASKIPEWVRSIFAWYSEDKISEDELINAIKFLIETNIIQLEQKETQSSNQSGTSVTIDITTNSISVFTDRSSYQSKESITISGTVSDVIEGTPMTIQIFDPVKNQVQITQANVDKEGKYTTTVTSGKLWKQDGTYTVKVQYGEPNKLTQTQDKLKSKYEEINQPDDFTKRKESVLINLAKIQEDEGFRIEFDKDLTSKQENDAILHTYKIIHKDDGWIGDLSFYLGKPDPFHPSNFDKIFQTKLFISNEYGIVPTTHSIPIIKASLEQLTPEWDSLNAGLQPSEWVDKIINESPLNENYEQRGTISLADKEISFGYGKKELGYSELLIAERIP